jgi:arylsulfatase A-like enzyme
LFALGFQAGLIRDFFVAFLPGSLGALLWSLGKRRAASVTAPLLASFFWLVCAANAGNALAFGRSLSLSLALSARGVAWDIRDNVLALLVNPLLIASATVFLLGVVLLVRAARRPNPAPWRRSFASAGLLLGLFFFQQIPVWSRTQVQGSALSDQPVVEWFSEAKELVRKKKLGSEAGPRISEELEASWKETLENFRGGTWLPGSRDDLPEPSTRELRLALGLDPDRAPNLIFLVAETARALEFLGYSGMPTKVYPRLDAYLAKKGVVFEQTATSAAWTAKGLFQLLCGVFDSFSGTCVYRRYGTSLAETCLPQALGARGYRTYMMRAYHRYFEGAHAFESTHGITNFLDRGFFVARDEKERVDSNDWGISDEFFFPRVARVLEGLADPSRPDRSAPLFAYLLPVGTHAPWSMPARFSPQPEQASRYAGDPSYQGYLARFGLFDASVTEFLETLDRSPQLRNTVVVVIGDHGSRNEPPDFKLDPLRKDFLLHRVLAAVVTPGMRGALRSRELVHQVDFTSLLARLAGLGPDEVAGVGRVPLAVRRGKVVPRRGTPWIDLGPHGPRYVLRDRECYSEPAGSETARQGRLRCFRLNPGEDPMLSRRPERLGTPMMDDPGVTRRVREVLQASDARLDRGGALAPSPLGLSAFPETKLQSIQFKATQFKNSR